MVGKDRGTRKRKSVEKDDASDKKKKKSVNSKKKDDLTTDIPKTATLSEKKKKLVCSNKNEGPSTDVLKKATVSKKRQKQQQKTDLGSETDSPAGQVKPQSDPVKSLDKKKLKKKALPQGRRKGVGSHGAQKKKKIELKRGVKLSEICHKAKKLWEKGRRLDCASELQIYLTGEVYLCLAGKIPEVIFSHDMSRVIQWLIRNSNAERVAEIAKECAPVLVRMLQSKHAKYCVQVLMKQRSETVRKLIIENLFGNIANLATHPIAAPLLGEAYDRCANNFLRNRMKQELYSSLFTKQKNDKIKDLKNMFQTYPELIDSTLKGMNNMFHDVFDANVQKSPLIHDVLLDFLEVCPEKMGEDLSLRVLHTCDNFMTTKNGVMALLKSFSLSDEWERTRFLRGVIAMLPQLACSEPGHFMLIAFVAYMDDISLMEQTILRGLTDQLPEIASHVHGSKVLLDIISTMKLPLLPPRLTRMLNLDLDLHKVHRKKETLLKIMLTPLLQSVASKPDIWLADGAISVATYNILQCGKGPELVAAFDSLAKHVAMSKSVIKHHGKDYTVVEHPGVHKILKKMIDYDPLSTQEVKDSFGSALMKQLTDTTIKRWLESSRGCFMLSFLLKKFADPKLKKMIDLELWDRAVKKKVKSFTGGEALLELFKKK